MEALHRLPLTRSRQGTGVSIHAYLMAKGNSLAIEASPEEYAFVSGDGDGVKRIAAGEVSRKNKKKARKEK